MYDIGNEAEDMYLYLFMREIIVIDERNHNAPRLEIRRNTFQK